MANGIVDEQPTWDSSQHNKCHELARKALARYLIAAAKV